MKTLYEHCTTTGSDLLSQWHPTKNGDRTPSDVSAWSKDKVWWRCSHGHEWQAVVEARIRNDDGCPICNGKVVLPGFNDLASKLPELAAQWHPTLNGMLTPEQVTAFSNRKVWWICEKGHPFRATIAARARSGSRCPYCANFKALAGFNDLATKHPNITKQWHPELNGDLTPEMVTPGSHKKVWWECPVGHSWQAVVYSRTDKRNCGCPVCAGKPSQL